MSGMARPIDIELEQAIGRLRDYRERLSRGRIHLVLEVEGDVTVSHEVHADPMTATDIARLMQERPGVKR